MNGTVGSVFQVKVKVEQYLGRGLVNSRIFKIKRERTGDLLCKTHKKSYF